MRRILITFLLMVTSLVGHAQFLNMDALMFTAGVWGDMTLRRGVNLSGRWDWNVHWLPESPIQLTGYWQAGVGYWHASAGDTGNPNHTTIVSASPVLQIWVGEYSLKRNALFFELGIGPAYSTETAVGKRNLASHWHFEDKFGAGINIAADRPFQLIYRYNHYSNASTVMPNQGLDLHTLTFVLFFK